MKSEWTVSGSPKVLVVEDNSMVRQVSVGLLKLLKCETLEATDALAALDVLGSGAPVDLLFTDIVMPGAMNGIRLAQLARERRPNIKVLFTSGYSAETLPFNEPGVSELQVLNKPYGLADLSSALHSLLVVPQHAA